MVGGWEEGRKVEARFEVEGKRGLISKCGDERGRPLCFVGRSRRWIGRPRERWERKFFRLVGSEREKEASVSLPFANSRSRRRERARAKASWPGECWRRDALPGTAVLG